MELHEPGRGGVVLFEGVEGIVNGEHFVGAAFGDERRFGRLLTNAIALGGQLPPSLVDENPPHRLGGGREEMRPIVPLALIVGAHEPQPGFMHQRGGLQRLAGLLAGELAGGEAAQLGIHEWEQVVGGMFLASGERVEDFGGVGHGTNVPPPNPRQQAATENAYIAAAWLGHSVTVAANHYWQITDEDYERAAGVRTNFRGASRCKPLQR
jgi:hypothetical protein